MSLSDTKLAIGRRWIYDQKTSSAVSSHTSHDRESPLQTLQHGFQALELISESAGGCLSAPELANELGLRRRSCYRLLETLCRARYLVRFQGGGYGLGPEIERLHRSLSKRVAPDPRVLPSFARLHRRVYSKVVSINGWYGSDIIIQQTRSDRYEESEIGAGYRDYSTSRCSTKAILAFVGERQLLRYFASRAHPATTKRTITDFEPFREHLLEVAERGYALDLSETLPKWRGVAAPFFADSGFPLGSFGIAAPFEEFDCERETLIEAVTEAGTEASRALGYSGAYPPPSPPRRTRAGSTSSR